ncbi:MAG TPA: CPBP family intramembrane glutamic endopeptidase [Gallionellaceae bacterium]|nr:CPBP family intramembrane glutamic endopeptidase [Gallionellaceae bacterium]
MNRQHTTATPVDLVVVTAICFGLFILSSIEGVIRGFPPYRVSDHQLASLIFIELAMTMIAVSYLRIRHHDLRALFPVPTAKGFLAGGGLYLVTLAVALPLESLLTHNVPALRGANGTLQATEVSTAMIVLVSLVNGLYEEVFLLGFLQRSLLPSEGHFAVGTALLVRLSYHLYQGPGGVLFVTVFGAIVGYYYLKTGKLWPAVVAHIMGDVVGLAVN